MAQKSKFYMEIRPLHSEVTGSCYVCKVRLTNGEKRMFIVDLGMFQEKKYSNLNESLTFNAEDVSFVLITHNHVDHVGRLPLLYKRGCKANIYCTPGTAKALPINLEDTVKVMREQAKRQKKNILRSGGRGKNGYRNVEFNTPRYVPLYLVSDVEETMKHVVACDYENWISDPKLPQVRFKFFHNAHLPGAAIIWIQVFEENEEMNFLFTGDWNINNLFQGTFDFPEELRDIPLHIVTEATYGTTFKDEIKKSFRENIIRALERGETILLPVISQYRLQEILCYLNDMLKQKEISEKVPIFLCGPLGIQYTNLYLDESFEDIPQDMKDFVPKNLQIFNLRGNFLEEPEFGIYIATGGMGSQGPSISFLRKFLPNPNVFIQFSSYCAEETLGRRLMEIDNEQFALIGGVKIRKIAKVAYTSELSGHAKADELLEFLSGFKYIKTIMVAHGSEEAKQGFYELLIKSDIAKEVVKMERKKCIKLNRWGILDEKVWYD